MELAGGVCRQAERTAKSSYVIVAIGAVDAYAGVNCAGSGNGDGLAGPVDGRARVPQRKKVVNGGKVVGRYVFHQVGAGVAAGGHADAKLRAGGRRPGGEVIGIGRDAGHAPPLSRLGVPRDLAAHPVQRPRKEIVERLHAHHHRGQRGRNLRVAHIADVRHAFHAQIVNLGMERALHLRRRAAEADRHSIPAHFADGEPMPRQPVGNGRNVSFGGTEISAHLPGGEPMMEVGRIGIVLAGYKPVEGRLLRRIAAQDQNQAGHGQIRAYPATVVLGIGRGVRIALQRRQIVFVDSINDPHRGRDGLGHGYGRAEQCTDRYGVREGTYKTHHVLLPIFPGIQEPSSPQTISVL